MAVPLSTHTWGTACPVCGGTECAPAPTVDHLASYPFLPGGRDPLSTRRHVIAPHRIVDHERVVYGTGDRVPWDDAVKYGIVPSDEATKVAVEQVEQARANLEQATKLVTSAEVGLAAAKADTQTAAPAPVEPEPEPVKNAKRAKKGPAEDRARKPSEDR